jgi:uncharacterized protein (DUF58 family)
LKNFFPELFLTKRFFLLAGSVIFLFILSFPFPALFFIAQLCLVTVLLVILTDLFILFYPARAGLTGKPAISCKRIVPSLLSLGDDNEIHIELQNKTRLFLNLKLFDELPEQLQERDFSMMLSLQPGEKKNLSYKIRPVARGEYFFDKMNLYYSSVMGLAERKIMVDARAKVAVYPSVIQMKKFELNAFSRISTFEGIKKLRRLGHSYEFEQIKNYVKGDDYRSINWKATSRKNELMVNQYEDEKAQQVYSVIDKSRVMLMPFERLSLLDHSINSSLVISNIALQKKDKAGLITFSEKMGTCIKAASEKPQLKKIMDALYRQQESAGEANYEMLYYAVRNFIRGRSLVFLFTNFESLYATERVLPVLRKINTMHLLVTIFFINTEIESFAQSEVNTLKDIHLQTIAQKFLYDKSQMVQQLRQYGIQTILTHPKDLSLSTVNKYLELKSRGLI